MSDVIPPNKVSSERVKSAIVGMNESQVSEVNAKLGTSGGMPPAINADFLAGTATDKALTPASVSPNIRLAVGAPQGFYPPGEDGTVIIHSAGASYGHRFLTLTGGNYFDLIDGGLFMYGPDDTMLWSLDASGDLFNRSVTTKALAFNGDDDVNITNSGGRVGLKGIFSALNGIFAEDDEFVQGSDLRITAAGGVQYTASTDATEVAPLSGGDFSCTWVGIPATGTFCSTKAGGAVTGFSALAGVLSLYIDGTAYATPGPTAIPDRLAAYRADYSATTGEWSFYLNDELLYSGAGSAPYAVMRDGWFAAFTGIAYRSRVLNFVPTDDEAAGAAKGESRGRLAYQAKTATTTGNFVTGDSTNGTLSGASTTGFTWTTITANSVSVDFSVPKVAVSGKAGQTVTWSIDLALTGMTGVAVYGLHATTGTLYNPTVVGSTYTFTHTLPADLTFNVYGPASDFVLRIYCTFGIGASIVGSNYKEGTLLGTVADYRPEECTSLNRWLDASGNGYHLLPVAGAKALNPQVPKTRSTEFRYDLAGSALTDGPADWVFAHTGTGVLTATPPAYAKLIKPPVGVANSEAHRDLVNTVTNQSTGVITFNCSNLGTPVDSVIAGAVSHHE